MAQLLSAEFYDPRGLAFDAQLNALFIADRDNNAIRELNLTTGLVSTVAGNGTYRRQRRRRAGHVRRARHPPRPWRSARPGLSCTSPTRSTTWSARSTCRPASSPRSRAPARRASAGDGGPATSAELFDPSGVVVDSAGDVLHRRQRQRGRPRGDGQHASHHHDRRQRHLRLFAATMARPRPPSSPPRAGLALNSAENVLYIADRDNNAIRAVNLTTGIITTLAGTGAFGSTGDNGPATAAALSSPRSIAVDAAGNVYIADTLGNEIRMVAAGTATASVTVEPFAAIAPGNTTVVPRWACRPASERQKAQAIVLALADIANPSTAALDVELFPVDAARQPRESQEDQGPPGDVRYRNRRRSHLPRDDARPVQDLPAHHLRSASRSCDVVFQQGGHHLGNGVIPGTGSRLGLRTSRGRTGSRAGKLRVTDDAS